MKDGLTFALALLAAMCAENIPLMLVLALLAVAVPIGVKIANVCDFGHKKTAPRVCTSESGQLEE